ncbi:MAG: FtsQ-type POTRA domain-containing protein [Chloroflexaceae bacterium]|nr:FtsQ-type POTRA domain-containing protein [Chloroflexaceae bacterium]
MQRTSGNRRETGSQVRPGVKRSVGSWVASGRLVSLVLFLISIGVLVYLFVDPRFSVRQVEVEGNTVLGDEVINQLAGLGSSPIWFVDRAAAAERLLSNAYIEHASVSLAMPDRAIISVSERRPKVRWQTGGQQYLVDNIGRVLDIAPDAPDAHTLVIVNETGGALQVNDHVDPDALELGQILALRLPAELKLEPAMIGWDFGLGVYVRTHGSQTIVFGRTDDLERKLSILNQLLTDGTPFSYLDLRPATPFYREPG